MKGWLYVMASFSDVPRNHSLRIIKSFFLALSIKSSVLRWNFSLLDIVVPRYLYVVRRSNGVSSMMIGGGSGSSLGLQDRISFVLGLFKL